MLILIAFLVTMLGLDTVAVILARRASKEHQVGTVMTCVLLVLVISVLLILISYQLITGMINLPGM